MDLRIDRARDSYDGGEVESRLQAVQQPIQKAEEKALEKNAGVQPTSLYTNVRGAVNTDFASSILKNRLQAATSVSAAAVSDPKLASTKLTFTEDMKGHFASGNLPYNVAEQVGKMRGQAISFHADMKIDNMDRFLNSPGHEARIEGYINYPPLGGKLPITSGRFNLFAVDPDTGARQMRYQITFKGNNGKTYLLDGIKNIKDESGFDIFSDNTTLFTKIYEGGTTNGKVISTGVLHISLLDTLRLVQSIKVQAPDQSTKLKAITGFGKFFFGALWDEYLSGKLTRLFNFLKF